MQQYEYERFETYNSVVFRFDLLWYVKARLYPKWHAPKWDVGLLGGSKTKISKSLLEKWRRASPYPTKWQIFATKWWFVILWVGYLYKFLKMNIFQFRFLGRSRGVSCTFWTIETRRKKIPLPPKRGENPIFGPQNDDLSFCGGGTFITIYTFFSGFCDSQGTWHTPWPA